MNTRKRVYIVIGSIVLLTLTSCKSREDWRYVATSSTVSPTSYQQWETYYDRNGVKRESNGSIKVWLKHVPRINREEVIEIHEYEQRQLEMIKGMHSFIENMALVESPRPRFNNTQMVVEINCEKQEARTLYIGDYDLAGTLLSSETISNHPFSRIANGSNAERLLKAVCE